MIEQIAAQIKKKIGRLEPQTAIILGSGLGALAEKIEKPVTIKYSEIKGFPQSTIKGHEGRLVIGKLQGKTVLCMQGRIHLYEGGQPQVINTIIKAFQVLGIKNLIVTNAAGSLNQKMSPGSIMLISDHINFSGQNPLIGFNDEKYGPRFPDLSNAYDKDFRKKLKSIARKNRIKLFEGIYFMVLGPNFETAADIRAFKKLGADAVGMSTVPEVISAVHSQMKVLGLSVITNYSTGLSKTKLTHEETLRNAEKASQNLQLLVEEFVKWMM